MTETLPRPGEAPSYTSFGQPSTGWAHQNSPAERSQGEGSNARYNDKSMFAKLRSTISSEWFKYSGADIKPFYISQLSMYKARTSLKETCDCTVFLVRSCRFLRLMLWLLPWCHMHGWLRRKYAAESMLLICNSSQCHFVELKCKTWAAAAFKTLPPQNLEHLK